MFNLEPILARAGDKLISIAFLDHETGAAFYLNADVPMHPASTIKVHVMMEVFRQANEGHLSLEDRLPIMNSFTSIADDSHYSLDVKDDSEATLYPRIGENEAIGELTRLMIVRSSNLATNILLERVGTDRVNEFVQALGIEGVTIQRGVEDKAAFQMGMNNSATARGLTQTMDLLARKKVVSEQASDEMIDILLGQEFNESIPALLPNFVKVAHKTGWTNDLYHDIGIIYPEHREPYVLSIMTKGYAENQPAKAHECMAALSHSIYEQLR